MKWQFIKQLPEVDFIRELVAGLSIQRDTLLVVLPDQVKSVVTELDVVGASIRYTDQ